MPLGIVNDSDFDSELINSGVTPSSGSGSTSSGPKGEVEHSDIHGSTIVQIERGRGKGSKEVPDSLRRIIGETSEIEGRKEALAVAKEFGISPSSVSAYSNGATSTASMESTPNKSFIRSRQKRFQKRASNVMLRAIENITDEKLAATKASDLASVAKAMSGIIKDMEPPTESTSNQNNFNGPSIILMAPPLKSESSYPTITVNE